MGVGMYWLALFAMVIGILLVAIGVDRSHPATKEMKEDAEECEAHESENGMASPGTDGVTNIVGGPSSDKENGMASAAGRPRKDTTDSAELERTVSGNKRVTLTKR